jgi:trehalose 6-phosphate synthase/phosphatase
VIDLDWKDIALPVMKHYTDLTDGSSIEVKETSLVWRYEEADPDFGPCQAKELQDHLQSVLANEPVCVKSGHKIVELNPQVRKLLMPPCIISSTPSLWKFG